MTLVFDNIRFMQLFTGVLWTGHRLCRMIVGLSIMSIFSSLKCRIFRTLRNEANIIIQYYLVPLAFSLTMKYVTLNGHFTLNFHYH